MTVYAFKKINRSKAWQTCTDEIEENAKLDRSSVSFFGRSKPLKLGFSPLPLQ